MAQLNYKHFTLGVEEEYMVMDPDTRELKSHEQRIVQEGQKIIKDNRDYKEGGLLVGVGLTLTKYTFYLRGQTLYKYLQRNKLSRN